MFSKMRQYQNFVFKKIDKVSEVRKIQELEKKKVKYTIIEELLQIEQIL